MWAEHAKNIQVLRTKKKSVWYWILQFYYYFFFFSNKCNLFYTLCGHKHSITDIQLDLHIYFCTKIFIYIYIHTHKYVEKQVGCDAVVSMTPEISHSRYSLQTCDQSVILLLYNRSINQKLISSNWHFRHNMIKYFVDFFGVKIVPIEATAG